MRKVCSRCGEAKEATTKFFGRQAQKKDGLTPHCKTCSAVYDAARNRDVRNERLRRERAADAPRFAAYERTRRERHREKLDAATRLRKARWKVEKRDVYLASERRYCAQPHRRLIGRIRSRTRQAVTGVSKPDKTINLLGCTSEELCLWLETQFADGMSWDNMQEWEIDHKWPLSAFDLTDPRHYAKACNYRNLQPLFTDDNRRKNARMSDAERATFEAWRASL